MHLHKLLIILLSTSQIMAEIPRTPAYILKTLFPPSIQVPLRGYYKGNILNLDEGWCTVPEQEERLAFSMIFIKDVEDIDRASNNNTEYLQRPKNLPFIWYDLTLVKNDASYYYRNRRNDGWSCE